MLCFFLGSGGHVTQHIFSFIVLGGVLKTGTLIRVGHLFIENIPRFFFFFFKYCLLFTILHPFGTREFIRPLGLTACHKLDQGDVLVWVRGKAEKKCSLTFCVFEQTRSKCSSYTKKNNNNKLKQVFKASKALSHGVY